MAQGPRAEMRVSAQVASAALHWKHPIRCLFTKESSISTRGGLSGYRRGRRRLFGARSRRFAFSQSNLLLMVLFDTSFPERASPSACVSALLSITFTNQYSVATLKLPAPGGHGDRSPLVAVPVFADGSVFGRPVTKNPNVVSRRRSDGGEPSEAFGFGDPSPGTPVPVNDQGRAFPLHTDRPDVVPRYHRDAAERALRRILRADEPPGWDAGR